MANEKETEFEPLVSQGVKDDDEKEEMDISPFIRVKMVGDDIFDQDDDDDDDTINFDFYGDLDFDIVSSDSSSNSLSSQLSPLLSRRKQELTSKIPFNEDGFVKPESEEEQKPPAFLIDPGSFGRRRRDRVPLYLLNPDDYKHDPVKAMQIRRAIITYRHHQNKKVLILKLAKENEQLRKHVEELKALTLDLSRCGCPKNKTAALTLLDKKIEKTLQPTFSRGGREILAVPFNKPLIPLPSSLTSSAMTKVQPKQEEMESVTMIPSYKEPELASSVFVNRPSNQLLKDDVAMICAETSELRPSLIVAKKLEPSHPPAQKREFPYPSTPPKFKFKVEQISTVQSRSMMNSPTSLYPTPPPTPPTPPTASQLVFQARKNNSFLSAPGPLQVSNGKFTSRSSPTMNVTKQYLAPQSRINVGTSKIVPIDKDNLWKRMEEDDELDSPLLLHGITNVSPPPSENLSQKGKRSRKQTVLERNNDNGLIESAMVFQKSFNNSEPLSKLAKISKEEVVDDYTNSPKNVIATIDLEA
ncbi:unnamed protein product [Orchesella dallaii]|uniref:Uncharacterized protein n=1 Tax=Orchesella dallaii TaxID=48710 RepID=A0ABP1Q7H2_9HEXA